VSNAIREAGLGGARHGYTGFDARYWVVKYDGSVTNGGELVSPPLDFDNPEHRAQVDRAVAALKAAGARPTVEAGIHVHVDSSDLSAEQVAGVARVFTKFEDVIYRIASSGWRTIRSGARTYARPIPHSRMQDIAKARTDAQLSTAWYGAGQTHTSSHGHNSRYSGLNLHSHFYRRTIEFRVFNSSTNAKRVQGYIAICVALVEDARRGKKRSINKRYALGGMASGDTNESNAFHRFQQVLRYDAGMSLEDMKIVTRIWKDSVPQGDFVGGSIY
jgi:hypothetical protein